VCMSAQYMDKSTRGGLTPQSVVTEVRSRCAKLWVLYYMFRWMYLKGVVSPYGWVSIWVALDVWLWMTLNVQHSWLCSSQNMSGHGIGCTVIQDGKLGVKSVINWGVCEFRGELG